MGGLALSGEARYGILFHQTTRARGLICSLRIIQDSHGEAPDVWHQFPNPITSSPSAALSTKSLAAEAGDGRVVGLVGRWLEVMRSASMSSFGVG